MGDFLVGGKEVDSRPWCIFSVSAPSRVHFVITPPPRPTPVLAPPPLLYTARLDNMYRRWRPLVASKRCNDVKIEGNQVCASFFLFSLIRFSAHVSSVTSYPTLLLYERVSKRIKAKWLFCDSKLVADVEK